MGEITAKVSKRVIVILLVFLAIATALVGRLFFLQIVEYDYYLGKVMKNITHETQIDAERGIIYDRNMLQLATNVSTYRVLVDPARIDMGEENSDMQAQLVSEQLSRILGVDYDDVYEETQKKQYRDRTIKKNVDKETADLVLEAITKFNLTRQIYLEEASTRYYPYGSLASHVIGVMGTDTGLFGLEYSYNTYLTGTNGIKKTTTNARGESMPTKYDTYIDAKDGCNVITTLDTTLQNILEKSLADTFKQNNPTNGVCGIIMDVVTGEILAMADYPNFDLNDPYSLADIYRDELTMCGYSVGTEEYNKYYWNLVNTMWRNKAVTDTYYPGSTFKIMTSSMALEENVLNINDTFTCNGHVTVGNRTISCAKTSGHGTHDFVYMLQQSCNPTMINVGLNLGTSIFWKYFEDFGFTEKTGIDLPGESVGIYFERDAFTTIDLAVSAFGQGFSTTVIQELTAISAVANGGYLVTPHIVSAVTDNDGNVLYAHNTGTRRQVVSTDVCKTINGILADGVVNNGAARNAYVAGYRISAKTGTSEKIGVADNTLRIGSCVGYAPADDPQIAVIIMVDEPHSDSRAGGVVAAPYIAQVMSEALPYLGIAHNYTDKELNSLTVTVQDFLGMDIAEAKTTIKTIYGIDYEIRGNGSVVTAQIPSSNQVMAKSNGKLILYTEGSSPFNDEYKDVPNVVGMSVSAAIKKIVSSGFNVYMTGAVNYDTGSGAVVQSQTPSGKSKRPAGTIITIDCIHLDVQD